MRGVEHRFVVGEDAHLEVATAIGLRAEPRAREVGAPEVEQPSVDRDHLEMHPRARAHLHARRTSGGELGTQRTGRRRSMQDANIDATLREVAERLEERDVLPASSGARSDRRFDEHRLQVRGRDPNADLRSRDRTCDQLRIVVAIDEQLCAEGSGAVCLSRKSGRYRHVTKCTTLGLRVVHYALKGN